MVIFWNLLPWVIIALVLVISYVRKLRWLPLFLIPFLFVYNAIHPSYLPKSVLQRFEIPVFQRSTDGIQNRQLAPTDGKVYDENREEKLRQGLYFKQPNLEEKEK